MRKVTILFIAFVFNITLSACDGNSFKENESINVYTRDTESGTREAFFKGIEFSEAAEDNAILVSSFTEVSGNSDMIAKIKADEYGLGYISLSSLASSGLVGLDFNSVEATEENVLNNTYQLKRPFNYITRVSGDYGSTEVEQIVKAIVAYMSSVEGKAIILQNGGIVETSTNDVNWSEMSSNHSVCTVDNSAVNIQVGGSASVEKIAKAITSAFKGRCGNFNPLHNHLGSSAAYKGTQKDGDKDAAATYLDLGFASRAFKDSEPGMTNTFGQICWDAVVAVVNKSNDSVDDVTANILKKIFEGTFNTWDELE